MRQYAECDLSLSEKTSICMWHNKLCDRPGATSSMVECLEMFIKLSNDIVSEDGLDIPARLTWMDGLLGNDAVKDDGKDKFGFKVLFLLMCTPRTKDKELQHLEEFLNSDDFSLDSIASMSVHDIASRIKNMGMQNKNAHYIQQAFQKIKHVWGGKIPLDPKVLTKFDGIGMKIALLVVQYVYGVVKVSVRWLFVLPILIIYLTQFFFREYHVMFMLLIGPLNCIG